MDANCSLGDYVGRWAIRSTTRPAVWPFLCHALVDILPTAAPAGVFIRVHTAGGALLRGYSAGYRTQGGGITLTGIECNGRTYDLTLGGVSGDGSRRGLMGTWTDAAAGAAAVAEGVWMAERQADTAARVAA